MLKISANHQKQSEFNIYKRDVLKESTIERVQIEKESRDVKGLAKLNGGMQVIAAVKELVEVSKDFSVEGRWKPTQDLRADITGRLQPGESLHVKVGQQDGNGKFESISITHANKPRLEERKSVTQTDIFQKTMDDAAGTAPHRADPPTEFVVERPARDGDRCAPGNLDGRPGGFVRSDSAYRAIENELMTRHGSVRAVEPQSDRN
ncbi:hypothetical protein F1735_30645 [Massilia sp. CCM 8694]|uniref:Uncharacterized protein n=2 Tax=Massilia genomosp. 1 TaxID=2609280 RepID=A0ABX0MV17_9BURK|nr:hypothetical protein [Massilia genomosp. 1]